MEMRRTKTLRLSSSLYIRSTPRLVLKSPPPCCPGRGRITPTPLYGGVDESNVTRRTCADVDVDVDDCLCGARQRKEANIINYMDGGGEESRLKVASGQGGHEWMI